MSERTEEMWIPTPAQIKAMVGRGGIMVQAWRDSVGGEKNVPKLSFEEEKRVLKQAVDKHHEEDGNSTLPL